MSRPAWMDRPHEFREDSDDYSMCRCGVPALVHDRVEHPEPIDSEDWRGQASSECLAGDHGGCDGTTPGWPCECPHHEPTDSKNGASS